MLRGKPQFQQPTQASQSRFARQPIQPTVGATGLGASNTSQGVETLAVAGRRIGNGNLRGQPVR